MTDMKKNTICLLTLLFSFLVVLPASALEVPSPEETTPEQTLSPVWKVTAMAGSHMFVDYLGGVRVGAAPEIGLRVSRWFVNKWGNRELGAAIDLSGVSGRVAGNNFAYNRIGVSALFDLMQASASSAALSEHFGVVPYVHAAVAFAPNGVAVPFGIGGYLEWRFDEHLAIQGELRGSFLDAKKVRDINGNMNVAGNASATIGVSWSF